MLKHVVILAALSWMASPTDDQEVTGLTLPGSATFFRGDLIMKYFLRSFSPFC